MALERRVVLMDRLGDTGGPIAHRELVADFSYKIASEKPAVACSVKVARTAKADLR